MRNFWRRLDRLRRVKAILERRIDAGWNPILSRRLDRIHALIDQLVESHK
jgi:hypothetical protein